MIKEDIVQKFILAGRLPTRYTIQEVLGISAQTLVRRGFSVGEIKSLYKELTKEKKHCLVCGRLLVGQQEKFCSSSCSAKFNNKHRNCTLNEKVSLEKQPLCNNCTSCGKHLSSKKSKFCSTVCHHKHLHDLFIESWLSGNNVQVSKGAGGISNHIRKYLFDKFKSKCSRCGWCEINPATGKTPLEVEHIDGNSDNNSPENLTLLCPNCHSLTPTYKALNKGNGRHERRKRYLERKSY